MNDIEQKTNEYLNQFSLRLPSNFKDDLLNKIKKVDEELAALRKIAKMLEDNPDLVEVFERLPIIYNF